MHILYIYSEITIKGGADKVIVEKANFFAQQGYEVTIITESQMGREPSFPLDEKVKHIDLGLDFNEQYRHGSLKRLWIYTKLMCQYRRKLADILKRESADISITTMGRSIGVLPYVNDGSIKIGEAHNKKQFLRSLHLLEQRGGLYKYMARYLRFQMEKGASKLDALVLLTPDHEKDWKGIAKTYVIPNSIQFFPTQAAALNNKSVLMVGRYNDAKGYNYLIPAWDIVHKRHPDWILNVYGSGEMRELIDNWINERNLQSTIILHEPVTNIMEKYLESSICVLSSLYEGFPLVILEGMACGVPFVSFDCPYGPRTIIKDGEDGLVVEYLNSQALAEGICHLIEDEPLRKKMGAQARKNILRYSKDVVMKQWVDLFESLTKKE